MQIVVQVLQPTLLDKQQGQQAGERQQQIEADAEQIEPGVAKTADTVTGETADQRKGHGPAAGSREEVLHRQPHHLAEVAQAGLTGIGLPVGIGHKADCGIQRQIDRQPRQMLGIERQEPLQQ